MGSAEGQGLWIEVPPSGVVDLDARMAPGGEPIMQVPQPDGGTVPVIRPLTIRPAKPRRTSGRPQTGGSGGSSRIDAEQEARSFPGRAMAPSAS